MGAVEAEAVVMMVVVGAEVCSLDDLPHANSDGMGPASARCGNTSLIQRKLATVWGTAQRPRH